MKTKKARRGRPPKGSAEVKSESILLRLATAEKRGFQDAADAAGVPLAIWIRERLRRAAAKELEAAGKKAAFLT